MSKEATKPAPPPAASSNGNGAGSQPQIRIEERKLSLLDFLRTTIKINGSDLHLQANSVPMIRVDGRPKFLEAAPPPDEWMKEYVDTIMEAQQEPAEKRHILEQKGAVDVAFPHSPTRFPK